jgi:hypothetical protein
MREFDGGIPLMVTFEREVNLGFPAAKRRWETPLSIVLFSALFIFASVVANGNTTVSRAGKSTQNPGKPAGITQASPQKHPAWRVKVVESSGAPFVSVHAKKAPFSDVASEMGRQLKLKVPIHLTDKAKQQLLTIDFDDLPMEAAVRLLSPHAVIDYVMNGGADPLYPARKQALTIYFLGSDEKAPEIPPWIMKDPSTEMYVGMVYATEDEEKAELEKRKKDLQVTYNDGLFTLHVHEQFLTDVLEEIAAKAGIGLNILTTNGAQKEIDQKVTWDVAAVSLEELTNTWFPSGIRLYSRTDLEKDVSKPLRLTIEANQDAQAEQNVTP